MLKPANLCWNQYKINVLQNYSKVWLWPNWNFNSKLKFLQKFTCFWCVYDEFFLLFLRLQAIFCWKLEFLPVIRSQVTKTMDIKCQKSKLQHFLKKPSIETKLAYLKWLQLNFLKCTYFLRAFFWFALSIWIFIAIKFQYFSR